MSNPRAKVESEDTGRLAYRHYWDPVDERPLLAEYACRCRECREYEGFWKDQTERMVYEDAVEANPRRPAEGPMEYTRRLSEIVAGKYARVKSMPRARQSRREQDAALERLRAQEVEIL